MEKGDTDWTKSVACVVIKEGKVLLGRQTYGPGNGFLIIPGGYINKGEEPEEAAKREVLEETGITVCPTEIIGIRFSQKDWYVIFSADFVSGTAEAADEENSEVIWLDIEEALKHEDVPGLTKSAIRAYLSKNGLKKTEFRHPHGNQLLYLYADGFKEF